MKRKLLMLYNPSSGISGNEKKILDVVRFLSECNCEITLYPIIPSRQLTSETIVPDGDPFPYESIILFGGDGTMNHLINTMVKRNIDVPVGYIPTGSTNDFSRTLYGTDTVRPEEICRYIAEKRTIRYDIGKFNDKYFNYVAAFGAFSKVSYATPQDMKNTMGYAAYILSFIAAIPEDISYQRHVRVVCDDQEWEGDCLLGGVTNSVSVGGVRNASLMSSSITDGLFELTLIRSVSNAIELGELAGNLVSNAADEKYFRSFRGKHFELYFDQQTVWTLDGEEGFTANSVTIDVCPKVIEIYAPVI